MDEVAIYRDVIERAYNQGDLSVIDEYCSDDFLDHQYPAPTIRGKQVMRDDVTILRQILRDLHLTIKHVAFADGNLWSLLECNAVDNATNKPVRFDVMDLTRFEKGKMVEHWGVPDRFALLHQTGKIQ